MDQAAEMIDDLDDGAKSSAAVQAASEAIGDPSVEGLQAAASGLGGSEALTKIAAYLNEAADALESYRS